MAATALFGWGSVRAAVAQDSHYWSYQYGTRANLLSGAVVGSVVDISATYYNPGGLALIDEPDLISTSKVVELSNVTLDPDEGIDVALNDLRFDFAPGFVAGIMPFRFLGDNVLAYSVFTRYLFKAELNAAASTTLDEIADSLSGDFFGQIVNKIDLSESWVGLSYSARVGQKLGLGITQYVAYRSEKSIARRSFEVLTDSLFGIANSELDFKYYNYRVLWKLGATFDWLGASLGVTLTTPSVSVFGQGSTLVNVVESQDTILVADFQDGLKASYKSPLSLAFGASYRREASTLHLTAEYFTGQDRFTIMEPEPFVGQSTGDTISPVLTGALDNILNFGVGLEHRFKPTLSGYLSFRTDFSAKVDDGSTSDVAVSSWDLYFLTSGVGAHIGTADLTLGIAYGFGGKNDVNLRDLIGDDDGDGGGAPNTADARYRSLRFIFALAI